MKTFTISLNEEMALIPGSYIVDEEKLNNYERTRICYRILSMKQYALALGKPDWHVIAADGRVHFRGNDQEDLITICVNDEVRFKVVDEESRKIIEKRRDKRSDGYYYMLLWEFIAYALTAGIKVENDEVEFDAESSTIHFTKEPMRLETMRRKTMRR